MRHSVDRHPELQFLADNVAEPLLILFLAAFDKSMLSKLFVYPRLAYRQMVQAVHDCLEVEFER